MNQNHVFNWSRTSGFSSSPVKHEKWFLNHGEINRAFDVEVRFGKPYDVNSIKRDWSFREEIELCNKMREFFEKVNDFVPVTHCPVCKTSADVSEPSIKIGARITMCVPVAGMPI